MMYAVKAAAAPATKRTAGRWRESEEVVELAMGEFRRFVARPIWRIGVERGCCESSKLRIVDGYLIGIVRGRRSEDDE